MIGHCDSNVLSVLLKQRLQHNNKRLRRIFINPEDACYMTDYDKYRPSRRFYRETIDVQLCENVTAGLLLPLLNDMIDHIKGFALTVTGGGRESHLKDWTCFSNFGSPNIRCMNIGFTSATESIFASVIRNCPALEMIEFHHGAKPTSIIYNALQSLPTLHSFTINNEKTCNTLPNSVNSRDLLNFFTHYASLGDQSTLDEIRLCHIDDLDLVTLLEMTEIETLKEVELCDINTPHNLPLDHPIQALKTLSLLERIVIKMGYREVTDVGIQQLDCKTIELSSLEYITTEGISNLIKNSSKLEELRVSNCGNNSIRTDIIQTLAEDKNIVFSP
ncbi:hypothetical protein INT45_000575 [Circinella minor]|uniref:Uncharacterized protein n=1 Tax=Circinella minor TaxID=1195481 RepID=A0A8H7SDW5_9FUNG|nr:hypothetical protein INT45_000575 [Circinella minor]